MHDRWRSLVENRNSSGRYVHFSDLVQFITAEARKARNPIFGIEAMKKDDKTKKKQEKTKTSATGNFAASTADPSCASDVLKPALKEVSEPARNQSSVAKKKWKCLFCGSEHNLNTCEEFKKKSVEERREFAKKEDCASTA